MNDTSTTLSRDGGEEGEVETHGCDPNTLWQRIKSASQFKRYKNINITGSEVVERISKTGREKDRGALFDVLNMRAQCTFVHGKLLCSWR